MTKPLIQLALDETDLNTALVTAKQVADSVDVIEVGTILAFAEGMRAVRMLRARYPKHILVCDMKTTDAGGILAEMAFNAGADWITVSAAAHIATIESCKKIADYYQKEIQIEIYGNWTFDDAQAWVDLGINQAIYHRARDAEIAGKGWTEDDLVTMKKLSKMGLSLSITGGIVPENIYLFKDINAKAFIAGRAFTGEKGKFTVEKMRLEIDKYWS
ncbi:3-keto-L-gulonate-6-phosphate decarboxylase UlaD [Histophilus somni]|uniref:3-keto-L-gulonate-6-phosphate decarboxylase UlaD n=1 Tax=Histophilus somni TaxID=731 RepID=UPI003877B7AD